MFLRRDIKDVEKGMAKKLCLFSVCADGRPAL